MKRFFSVILLILIGIAFFSCDSNILENKEENELNAVLNVLAPDFANAILNSSELAGEITTIANTYPDGDRDCLYSSIKDFRFSGSNSRGTDFMTLADIFDGTIGASSRSQDEQSEIEKLLNFYFFDPDGTNAEAEAVVVIDYSVDDMELEYLTAYKADGTTFQIDAKEEPDFPVIVFGYNERTNYTEEMIEQENENRGNISTGGYIHTDWVKLKSVKDGWWAGRDEAWVVYIEGAANFIDAGYREYPSLDDAGDEVTGNISWLRYNTGSNPVITAVWIEDDVDGSASASFSASAKINETGAVEAEATASLSGSIDLTAGFCGKKFTVSDDLYDKFYIYPEDPYGMTYNGGSIAFALIRL